MTLQMVKDEDIYEPPWPEFEPLAHSLPAFPLNALPNTLGRFVLQSSTELQTPPDLQAMFCLSVIASAIARKFKVHIESKNWHEPTNIYTCSVLDVGNRKSAACSQCTRPLSRFELELIEREREGVAIHNHELQLMQTKLKEMQRKIARGPTKTTSRERLNALEDDAKELSRQLATIIERRNPEVLADDATPQALEQALFHNGSRICFHDGRGCHLRRDGGKMGQRYSRSRLIPQRSLW